MLEIINKHLKIQDELNEIIQKDWRNHRTIGQLELAFLSEFGEFLDSYQGWKWWKHYELDDKKLHNIKVEIVDMYHFLLSEILLREHQPKEIKPEVLKDEQLPFMIATYLIGNYRKTLNFFFGLVERFFNSIDEFDKFYRAKVKLNIERQNKGYKDGTYQKGEGLNEDNYTRLKILLTDENKVI